MTLAIVPSNCLVCSVCMIMFDLNTIAKMTIGLTTINPLRTITTSS